MEKMKEIEDVKIVEMTDSKYLRPFRMEYKQNGVKKMWDLLRCHSSVSILIFNTTRKVFVFVKQFRPAVFISQLVADRNKDICVGEVVTGGNPAAGVTVELCAGIVDKDVSLEELAAAEVLEECGYSVLPSRLTKVLSFPSSVGSAGDTQTLFWTTVTDSERVSEGGGLAAEGELIQVVEMTVDEVKRYMAGDYVNSPAGFFLAVNWFLANKPELL